MKRTQPFVVGLMVGLEWNLLWRDFSLTQWCGFLVTTSRTFSKLVHHGNDNRSKWSVLCAKMGLNEAAACRQVDEWVINQNRCHHATERQRRWRSYRAVWLIQSTECCGKLWRNVTLQEPMKPSRFKPSIYLYSMLVHIQKNRVRWISLLHSSMQNGWKALVQKIWLHYVS